MDFCTKWICFFAIIGPLWYNYGNWGEVIIALPNVQFDRVNLHENVSIIHNHVLRLGL